MRRFLFAFGFAFLLGMAFLATRSDAQPGSLKQIVPGVWFREGEIKDQGHCNNIIIEMKDYLIVVDANFPSGARLAMADARKVSPKPVKYVFDTHHHGDHLYGNPVWTQAGATTLAYKGVAEELQRYEPKAWQATAKTRKDVAELNLPTAEPPKQTFDKTPFILDDGSRRVEFHFFGWAHTRGDGFVFLPVEKVLCTGDALVNGPYNFTGQGNIGNWNNVLKAAQRLGATHILPGHGGPSDATLFNGQMAFFTELQKAAADGVKAGKKPDEITVAFSPAAQPWAGNPLRAQIKDAYEEITESKPHGEILGGK